MYIRIVQSWFRFIQYLHKKVRVWSRYGKKLVFADAKFILRGITQEQQQNYFYDYQKPMDEGNIMLIFRNG